MYGRYPFLFKGGSRLSFDERMVEEAKERLARVFKEGKLERKGNAEREVAIYALVRAMLSITKKRHFISRYAVAESKRVFADLESGGDSELLTVAKEIGVAAEKAGENKWKMNVFHYLRFSPRDYRYKLVNRELREGWVWLRRSEVARVAAEGVKIRIEKELPLPVKNVPPELEKAVAEVTKDYRVEAPRPVSGEHPPCIMKLLEDLKAGINLPHTARFFLAVYLLNRGMGADEVVKAFSTSPDYNEKTTRYQVEFAKKKGYKVPNCSAVGTYGFCVANCRVSNPLNYRGKK